MNEHLLRQRGMRVKKFLEKIIQDNVTRKELLENEEVVNFLKEISIVDLEPDELANLLVRLLEHIKLIAIHFKAVQTGGDVESIKTDALKDAQEIERHNNEYKIEGLRKAVIETIKIPEQADELIRRIDQLNKGKGSS